MIDGLMQGQKVFKQVIIGGGISYKIITSSTYNIQYAGAITKLFY
jgi:hypothetical protein